MLDKVLDSMANTLKEGGQGLFAKYVGLAWLEADEYNRKLLRDVMIKVVFQHYSTFTLNDVAYVRGDFKNDGKQN